MSAAAAAPPPEDAAPPAPKGKKKLILIIAAVLLVLAAGGGGAFFYMKKKAADAAAAAEAEGEATGDGHKSGKSVRKHDPAHTPTFLPLEPFVVNLADKEVDRYAQIGVTLEVEDPKSADQLKAYMPAIRNGILMVLAHKSSQQLLERAGKEALAEEIMREAVRPLGIDVDATPQADEAPEPEAAADDAEDGKAKSKKKPKPPKKAATPNPVRQVHFSNFIIQ
jgi:flagellar FliL protein